MIDSLDSSPSRWISALLLAFLPLADDERIADLDLRCVQSEGATDAEGNPLIVLDLNANAIAGRKEWEE